MVAIKRRYTTAGTASRRTQSRVYYVQCGSGMSSRVCRKAFLHIHAVSGGRIDRALKSFVEAGGSPQMDKRGRHEPGNKTPEESISLVKDHICSFPQYESHYSRGDNPNRKYLSPDLTVAKMYSMYKETCSNGGSEPVSEWLYCKTFNENFKLSFGRYAYLPPSLPPYYLPFLPPSLPSSLTPSLLSLTLPLSLPPIFPPFSHSPSFPPSLPLSFPLPLYISSTTFCVSLHYRPRTDTCKVCDEMKVKVDAESDPTTKQRLKGEWDLHKRRAERAYQQLKEDTALAKSSSDVDTITFDLEQSLPTPVLTTNIVFYKRQLWTYNLGIHDCKTSKAYMHMWHKATASRGSQEVASCLHRHFKSNRSTAKQLIAFSDACGGQNRNINMVCMWLHVVASNEYPYTLVDHKFMVSGHSYLPNDRDFGCIETARRRQEHIFIPDDCYDLVERARRTNPFTVVRMTCTDFISVNRLTENITNRKKDMHGDKVEWLRMRWIRVEKDKPYQFSYRCVVYVWCCIYVHG